MRLTPEEYAAIVLRLRAHSPHVQPVDAGVSPAEPQHPVRRKPVGKVSPETDRPGRVHVRITSRRVRLLDPDNLCPKYVIDCLRYAGAIRNDDPGSIDLYVTQEKVEKAQEGTLIEIWGAMTLPAAEDSNRQPTQIGADDAQT